jgi:hypothetical protein
MVGTHRRTSEVYFNHTKQMKHKLTKINYTNLNSKQKENYNFQKVSSILADYGFATLRLSDDWQGADFIASHINGEDFIKVQLKSRFSIYKKYLNKDIWICFPYKGDWYMYPHDQILGEIESVTNYQNTISWLEKGGYSSDNIPKSMMGLMEKYKL